MSLKMPDFSKNAAIVEMDTLPQWLNADFFKKILSSYENTSKLLVQTVNIEKAGGNGENYASVIFRVRVIYKTKKQQKCGCFMVKTAFIDNPAANEILSKYNVYDQELDMYHNIFPDYQKLLTSINDNVPIVPQAIHCDYKEKIIVFEDLSVKGYVMADRKARLDLVHVKLILVKLAKMHAASVVIQEQSIHNLRKYQTGMFNRKTAANASYFLTNFDAMTDRVAKWGGSWDYYVQKLRNLRPQLIEKARQSYDPDDSGLNVLIHGDLWTNNVMFKYTDQTPIDVLFIDFQFMCWSSPAVDLHYLFHTSLMDDVRENCIDELVQYYHSQLVGTLMKLKCQQPIPTLQEFQVTMLKRSFGCVVFGLLSQPTMIVEESCQDEASFDTIIGTDKRALEFKKNIYRNEKVHRAIKHLLPLCDRRGLLN